MRLAPSYIEYENRSLLSDAFARIEKSEVADIKHEMDFIIWYRFYVGCEFKIDIKTKGDGVVKIVFRSYFSKNEEYTKAYAAIVDVLWNYYLSHIVDEWKAQFSAGYRVEFNGVMLVEQGVYLLKSKCLIQWEEIEVKEYQNYYTIYDRNRPENNRLLRYNEWGSEVLFSLIKVLSEGKK